MLDESSILDEDPTATCLLMKKEILELNSHIEIVKNRNQFLQDRFQFYQYIKVGWVIPMVISSKFHTEFVRDDHLENALHFIFAFKKYQIETMIRTSTTS